MHYNEKFSLEALPIFAISRKLKYNSCCNKGLKIIFQIKKSRGSRFVTFALSISNYHKKEEMIFLFWQKHAFQNVHEHFQNWRITSLERSI